MKVRAAIAWAEAYVSCLSLFTAIKRHDAALQAMRHDRANPEGAQALKSPSGNLTISHTYHHLRKN